MRLFHALTLGLLLMTGPGFAQVDFWKYEWPVTDFTKFSIPLSGIMGGGPPRDGIPAVTDPAFISAGDETRLGDREPVVTVEIDGQTPRTYPIRYLMWHEIVNDTIGDVPIAVTFCPLCNSAITFDRRVNGEVLNFGVSGKLAKSNLIMFDRQTESWWQQFLGEAIVGEMTGAKLKKLPGWMESWADFKARNPDGLVMDQPKANRRYGSNPYTNYDTGRPFLYNGENPPNGVNPMIRVVSVGDTAWPLTRLREVETITEAGVTITWKKGTASALDGRSIAKSRDVGAIRVVDAKTGEDIPHDMPFAFAFYAFFPDGKWMLGN
jgi:uncharacterized protein DUF3179